MKKDYNRAPVDPTVNHLATTHPILTVRLISFPESNGKRNWTAHFMRVDAWDGLAGNYGGITIARGELWNRVAYESERAKFLLDPDYYQAGCDGFKLATAQTT